MADDILNIVIDREQQSDCIVYQHCGQYTELHNIHCVGDIIDFMLYLIDNKVERVVYYKAIACNNWYISTLFNNISRITNTVFEEAKK